MAIRIIGEHPLARDESGAPRARIATIFPRSQTLVTVPGIHATQRMAYVDLLNEQRRARGLCDLSEQEQLAEWANSVDLIIQSDCILIRPDPQDMPLAFEADELLQELLPKQQIKFLLVRDEAVRDAIKRRGECWRISPLPRSPAEMTRMIQTSRIGISGRPIYYYNATTGTRFLTHQEFSQLSRLSDDELRQHLVEIRESLGRSNRMGHSEIELFAAEGGIGPGDFAYQDFRSHSAGGLRSAHEALARKFAACVRPQFQRDDLHNTDWRNRMCAALLGSDEAVAEESLLGLSPEFYMQIEWLPGGRIEAGELIFDSVLDEPSANGVNGRKYCDDKPRGFIFNFIREYGDIEYVNVGRVIGSLSQRPPVPGRRDVYIAEIKLKGVDREMVRMIRMQKWGVREHLDEGKSLLDSIIESEDYTEYTLDRRLGARQLGMNLPARLTARKIGETYCGKRKELEGTAIWSPYFERDYIRGIATDKLPAYRFEDEAFALRLAHLLGRAAAANIIIGRADLNGRVIFDDGDEVVIEGPGGSIADLVVTDHTGTFVDYRSPLASFAAEYAAPINRRVAYVHDPKPFAHAYIEAFVGRFAEIQQEYRKRRRAFNHLFSHRRRDEAGSFAYRWELILSRLDRTNPRELGEEIRRKITL